ncbi:MAG: ABC transporter substrate-binding protein [Chloroflexi bacterium]|nr:ABC transporter substrate-binding protein [Chloroflexota bacterium]
MKKGIVWLLLSCLMALSLVLASCAPAAPTTPTTPTTSTVPTAPITTPAAPTTTETAITTGAETVKLRLTKKDGTAVEKTVEKPKYGGTINFPLNAAGRLQDFDNVYTNTPSLYAHMQTHDDLVKGNWAMGRAGTGEIAWTGAPGEKMYESWRGAIAESWEIPDEQTIIYHIRRGIRWQINPHLPEASALLGGRELTADDVVFSIRRMYNMEPNYPSGPTYAWGARMAPYEHPVSVKALDKWTVEVKIQPGYMDSLLEATADFSFIQGPIELIKKYGDVRDWRRTIGTGPFMLADFVSGSVATFVRNPNYWDKDPLHPQNQIPYVDTVKMFMIPDRSTRMSALRTGKLDVLGGDRWGLEKDDAKILIKRIDKPELPWYDKRVRQALQLAFDNQAVLRDYYGGEGVLLAHYSNLVEGWMDMYTPVDKLPESSRELFEYHPDKAKKLLAEAGYPNGFTIEVLAIASEVDYLLIFKEYWAKIGVNLVVDVRESTVKTSISNGKTHKHAVISSSSAFIPFAFQVFNITDTPNTAMVDDPVINDIRKRIKGSYVRNEPEARRIMREELVPYVIDQSFQIYFPAPEDYALWWPWLKAYHGEFSIAYTNYWSWTQYVWVDQALKKSIGF